MLDVLIPFGARDGPEEVLHRNVSLITSLVRNVPKTILSSVHLLSSREEYLPGPTYLMP